MRTTVLRGINPPFGGLSPFVKQIAYALRTRAPVAGGASTPLPLDLHVLGLSLAFILSQDQTLHCNFIFFSYYLRAGPDAQFLELTLLLFPLLHYINIFKELSLSCISPREKKSRKRLQR